MRNNEQDRAISIKDDMVDKDQAIPGERVSYLLNKFRVEQNAKFQFIAMNSSY